MKKNVLKISVASVVFGAGILLVPCTISAADVVAPIANDECAKELLLSYFPEPIVTETLKRFNVPEDKLPAIVKSLSSKDKEVVKIVEQKASAMTPNPLKDPQQRQAAMKLFRETLLQVFTSAMKENGIEDTSQFQAMLDDIQQQKAKKFAMCMEKHRAHLQQSNESPSGASFNTGGRPFGIKKDNDTDNDNDDEDDDDEDDDTDDEDTGGNKAPTSTSKS